MTEGLLMSSATRPPRDTRAYHERRKQWCTVLAPGAPDTTWVVFDGDNQDAEEVTTVLLDFERDPGTGRA